MAYWSRMVRISYDPTSGLIEVRVLAFTADDATLIARTLFDDSSKMINELSAIAREDSIRYARQDLDEAVERLKTARQAVTEFRNRHQMVDPKIDLANQGGLLGFGGAFKETREGIFAPNGDLDATLQNPGRGRFRYFYMPHEDLIGTMRRALERHGAPAREHS